MQQQAGGSQQQIDAEGTAQQGYVYGGGSQRAGGGCRPGACAFSVQRRTRTETGMIYEYTQSLIRADRVTLDVYLHKDGVSFTRSVDK